MGPIDSPPIPTAWRAQSASVMGPRKVGLELIGRKKKDGTDAVYWGTDYADCYKLAAQDGWKL